MFDRITNRFVTSVLLVLFVFASTLGAQSLPVADPETVPRDPQVTQEPQVTNDSQVTTDDPKPVQLPSRDDYFQKGFARQLISDQRPLWTSPARIKASDAKWLLPLAAGTAFLFTQDTKVANHFQTNTSLKNSSLKVGTVGLYAPWAMSGAFIALGKAKDDDRMMDTGKKTLQAAVYAQGVMQVMKLLTDRARPVDGGNGHFFSGGDSFPSGHSMEAWALAKVVADEYSDKPLVKIGMYSFATAVSLSRISGQRHYPSDVLVGSAVGYLIGKFVMRNHQQVQPIN